MNLILLFLLVIAYCFVCYKVNKCWNRKQIANSLGRSNLSEFIIRCDLQGDCIICKNKKRCDSVRKRITIKGGCGTTRG